MAVKTRRAAGRRAFTLVELLVVIVIIMLLIGILVPSIASVLRLGATAQTLARIQNIESGVLTYHQENSNLFPGQHYIGVLNNRSYTGSQWLARAMFSKPGAALPADGWAPESGYATYQQGMLDIKPPLKTGRKYSVLDTFARPKAICYYVARRGLSGLNQFNYDDNSVYTGDRLSAFRDFVKDHRWSTDDITDPFKSGEFLLISAGEDAEYFSGDDPRNFRR